MSRETLAVTAPHIGIDISIGRKDIPDVLLIGVDSNLMIYFIIIELTD